MNKPWLFRIYEWPLSYLIGLMIGFAVTHCLALWDSNLSAHLQPTGAILFRSGWAIIIGAGFGTGMDKVIDLPPPTKLQKWVCRSSIVTGIALTTVAWVFYATPPEEWDEASRPLNKNHGTHRIHGIY